MNHEKIVITLWIVSILLVFIVISYWLGIHITKQSKKDWETLEELEKKANSLTTLEEIEEFYKEFVEKANKIHNEYIQPRLAKIDGYLKGMYKALGGK